MYNTLKQITLVHGVSGHEHRVANTLKESLVTKELIARYQSIIIQLNAAINTMRPGNLAELEDLSELLELIEQAKQRSPLHNSELQKAIDYANMVVAYVGDGSGTHDMIEKAITLLKPQTLKIF